MAIAGEVLFTTSQSTSLVALQAQSTAVVTEIVQLASACPTDKVLLSRLTGQTGTVVTDGGGTIAGRGVRAPPETTRRVGRSVGSLALDEKYSRSDPLVAAPRWAIARRVYRDDEAP